MILLITFHNSQYFQFIIIIIMAQRQLSKTIINLVRHQDIKQMTKPKNIFTNCQSSGNTLGHIKSSYHIIGDQQFKKKYCHGIKSEKLNKTSNDFSTAQDKYLNATFCNYARTIQDGTLMSKLSKQKQLELTRHRRTFMQFESHKHRQQKIKKHLQTRLSNFGTRKILNTITYSKQQIQLQPNPELIQLINDNIPQYWKNSLRDNQKRLKRHIKGNTFKKQVAQQMLQTLRGRKKLVESIPKVKQQFFTPICSRTCSEIKHKRSFSIKGQNKFRQQMFMTDRNSKQLKQKIPRSQFQQMYKINYNSASRWQGFQLC